MSDIYGVVFLGLRKVFEVHKPKNRKLKNTNNKKISFELVEFGVPHDTLLAQYYI